MNIVLLESLGISPERLSEYARPLVEAGHTFNAYPRDLDIQVPVSYTHLRAHETRLM